MPAVLALLSSLMWGVSDFVGGMTSRRFDALRVAALSVPLGVVPLTLVTVLVPGTLTAAGLVAGVAGGVCGAGGVLLLYHVLAVGPMGVVSPVTAVVAALVPVAVGLARGERPAAIAYLGMALTVVAIVLVSLNSKREDDAAHRPVAIRTVALSVASGALIGAFLSLIGTAPQGSGVWPVLVARAVSALLVGSYALLRFRRAALIPAAVLPAALMGTLDALANAAFGVAAQSGLLSIVSVLAALYPAATVLLARYYLHEHLRRVQQLGMLTALVAAALLALG